MKRRRSYFLWVAGVAAITLMGWAFIAETADAADKIKVGLILPMSGPSASSGQWQREAVELVVDRVNRAGGIKSMGGAQIVLEVADSRGQPEIGMSEAERLILKDKVQALMGCYQSGVTFTATTVAEKYKIPFVIVLSNSDQITQRGYKYTFRPHGTASMDQQILVDFLIDMGTRMKKMPERIALLCDSTEGTKVPAQFWRQFLKEATEKKRANFTTVFDDSYPIGMTDFVPIILKLKSARPDFIIIFSVSVPDVSLLAKNMASQRYAPNIGMLAFGGAVLDPTFVPTAGKNADYWFTIQGWTKDLLDRQPAWAREMYEEFKTRYNKELSGDACKVLLDTYTLVLGLEKAGTAEPEKLRDAIASLDIQEGPALMVATTSRVKFGPDGQNQYYESGVAQILDGGYHLIWPDKVAKPGYKVVWPAPQWKDRK